MSDEYSEERRTPAKVRLPLWAVGLLAVAVLLLLISTGVWVFQSVRRAASGFEVTAPNLDGVENGGGVSAESDNPNTGDPEDIDGVPELPNPNIVAGGATETPDAPLISIDTLKPWDGTERVNVLLLGTDVHCDDDGPTRTDTMMIVSVDPVGKSISALSLPRDTWVEVPGFGPDRINKAHYLGEVNEYPGGGPVLAVDTVENFIGIKINHYATINFQGFIDLVTAVDSIAVTVPEEIDDPIYPDSCYGYDPFYIEAGEQVLDGPSALKYARTRATTNGDIDRAQRQQQVLLAIRNKVLNFNMIPQLITQSPQLWRTLQDNFKTTFSNTQLIRMVLLVQEIPEENIRQGILDYNYVYNETTLDGQQVLVPNYDAIHELREDLFRPIEVPAQASVIENLPELMTDENARVVIHNGTQTFGLAGATRDYLLSQDINIIDIGNSASSTVPTTQIIDYGYHPNTVLFLNQTMGLPPLNSQQGAPNDDYDILIIIGNDWAVPE